MKIALCCTGSICSSPKEPQRVVEYLHQHGHHLARFQQETYLALPAERRAAIFFEYLQDDSLDVIWSLRGGEGSADILPFLAARSHLIRQMKPKILIGFSDFTAILIYFQQFFDWPCIHGPCARQLIDDRLDEFSKHQILSWLLHSTPAHPVFPPWVSPDLKPLNYPAIHTPSFSGYIIGGNLSLLQLSVQDIWELHPRGKVLLIEEVNEPPYKITRALKYLYRLGWFHETKAVIFGSFDYPNGYPHGESLMLQTLRAFAQECVCPVFFTRCVGHGMQNYPMPFFMKVTINAHTFERVE